MKKNYLKKNIFLVHPMFKISEKCVYLGIPFYVVCKILFKCLTFIIKKKLKFLLLLN